MLIKIDATWNPWEYKTPAAPIHNAADKQATTRLACSNDTMGKMHSEESFDYNTPTQHFTVFLRDRERRNVFWLAETREFLFFAYRKRREVFAKET